jgi:hypothetical protein
MTRSNQPVANKVTNRRLGCSECGTQLVGYFTDAPDLLHHADDERGWPLHRCVPEIGPQGQRYSRRRQFDIDLGTVAVIPNDERLTYAS